MKKTKITFGFENQDLIVCINADFDLAKLGEKEAETGVLFSEIDKPVWVNTKKLLFVRKEPSVWTKEDEVRSNSLFRSGAKGEKK